ncbi:hypothetical protein [Streptomyces sp. bgisy032]|uniref:hypothetical protein n=1 Tax=Streptomyces sp. bgisy032 TaxID=3413773 RepID=UPI003D737B03
MTYRLPSGFSVQAFDLGGGLFEFVTRNKAGETTSTVRLSGAAASRALKGLEAA